MCYFGGEVEASHTVLAMPFQKKKAFEQIVVTAVGTRPNYHLLTRFMRAFRDEPSR